MNRQLVSLAALAFAYLASLPVAQAVNPPPDGGYPGFNTAEGENALFSLDTSTGLANTAVGWLSLNSDVNGSFNTATGAGALLFNTADQNTATGAGALLSNTTGARNTANGVDALFYNTTGHDNTANGAGALQGNTDGYFNTATGTFALSQNSTGFDNTANSWGVLGINTTGHDNTASGFQALGLNTTGNNNTANGALALLNNVTGNGNTAFGVSAGMNATTGSNNVYIGTGMTGVAGESNACYIASIFGQTSANGIPVLINSNSKLGTATSSKRFKDDIKPMDKTSETIFALKPVTFHYKKDLDPEGIPQFGLVAEQVQAVNPALVVRDDQGKPYTVRYEAVNAMLLNEFLKEHGKVEKLEATVSSLAATVKEQAAQIQKVSAQLEANKMAARTVVTNQ